MFEVRQVTKQKRDRYGRIPPKRSSPSKETTKKGWATCGWNGKLRVHMGYAEVGPCMMDECEKIVDHGLSYVCGGEHRGGKLGCGRYVCESHLSPLYLFDDLHSGEFVPSAGTQICPQCLKRNEADFDQDSEPYLDMERT